MYGQAVTIARRQHGHPPRKMYGQAVTISHRQHGHPTSTSVPATVSKKSLTMLSGNADRNLGAWAGFLFLQRLISPLWEVVALYHDENGKISNEQKKETKKRKDKRKRPKEAQCPHFASWRAFCNGNGLIDYYCLQNMTSNQVNHFIIFALEYRTGVRSLSGRPTRASTVETVIREIGQGFQRKGFHDPRYSLDPGGQDNRNKKKKVGPRLRAFLNYLKWKDGPSTQVRRRQSYHLEDFIPNVLG